LGTAIEGFLDEDGCTAHMDVLPFRGEAIIALAWSVRDPPSDTFRGRLLHPTSGIGKGKYACHGAAGHKFLCLAVAQGTSAKYLSQSWITMIRDPPAEIKMEIRGDMSSQNV
jgi:hypothetical protein